MTSQQLSAAHYHVDEKKLAEFAAAIEIPACPRLIIDMINEQQKESPDINLIAALAEKDPAIAAALLKTVNSPYFCLRGKILSVRQATVFLGTRNVINIVTAIALKNASGDVTGEGPRYFWEMSSTTAAFAAELATRIIGLARDETYVHVLFRDAAIPLMIAYRVKSGQISRDTLTNKNMYMAQVAVEQSSIEHAIIGSHFTKKWLLPENTQQSVRLHVNVEMVLGENKKTDIPKWVSLQVAIGYLAEHITREFLQIEHSARWLDGHLAAFLKYVDIGEEEFVQITADILAEKNGRLMTGKLTQKK